MTRVPPIGQSGGGDLADDQKRYFGTDKNYSIRYDSTLNAFIIRDEISGLDLLEFDNGETVIEKLTTSKMDWSFVTGTHTNWGDAQSNIEIGRINLQEDEVFEVIRMEMSVKGGASVTDLSIDVYDDTTATIIDSVNAGSVSKVGGVSGTGSTILLRLTNNSGSNQVASVSVYGKIVEV